MKIILYYNNLKDKLNHLKNLLIKIKKIQKLITIELLNFKKLIKINY